MVEKNNTGENNSGDKNSGNWNSGNWNSGNRNSGDRNSGNWNSGDKNSGNWNSGYWNSGYWNSGNSNSGYWNSGDKNSGDRNSGYWNSGDKNSGDWNSGNRNSGYFNVDEPKVRIFGKDTDVKIEDINFPSWLYFELTNWVPVSDMTDQEKEESPNYKTTEGFLRVYKYKEAFKTAFDKADIEGIKQTLELPNFDYKIFEEISGISKSDFDKRLGKPSCYDHNNKSYTYCPHCGNKMEE